MESLLRGVKVEIGAEDGVIGFVKLNGVDFSTVVSEINYRHEAGQPPTLNLSINNIDEVRVNGVVGSVMLRSDAATEETMR